jgi:hypothetical protein
MIKRIIKRLTKLDQRVVYILIALAVIIPFMFPTGFKILPSKPVKNVFEAIEEAAKTQKPMLFSYDFDPGTIAELQPMSEAIISHAFIKDLPVIVVTFIPTGGALAIETLNKLSKRYKKKEGYDWVFLGFRPAPQQVILNMGREIRKAYSVDHREIPLDKIPLMKEVHSYKDISFTICVSSTGMVGTWVDYAVGPYNIKYAMGVTAVMATDYYPYLQTGQSIGLIGGMKGAAEYEKLMVEHKMFKKLGDAARGLDSQSFSHLLIILFIIAGNIIFFTQKKRKK